MPIVYRVVHSLCLVVARAEGDLSDEDIWKYQYEVWSREDVRGYNEIIDMSMVGTVVMKSTDRMRELVSVSAQMDPVAEESRFAIVAPQDHVFGLARMFQAYRELDQRSTKLVGVFRAMKDALEFLRIPSLPEV